MIRLNDLFNRHEDKIISVVNTKDENNNDIFMFTIFFNNTKWKLATENSGIKGYTYEKLDESADGIMYNLIYPSSNTTLEDCFEHITKMIKDNEELEAKNKLFTDTVNRLKKEFKNKRLDELQNIDFINNTDNNYLDIGSDEDTKEQNEEDIEGEKANDLENNEEESLESKTEDKQEKNTDKKKIR